MALFRSASRLSYFSAQLLHFNRCTAGQCQTRNIARWVAPTLKELRVRRKKFNSPVHTPRPTFIEWNYNSELFAFSERLHEQFDLQLLHQAFTNRSYVIQEELRQQSVGIENPEVNLKDNRELIGKGDEIMKEYVEAFLSAQLPTFPIYGIRAIQTYLLSDSNLALIGRNLGCKDLILSADSPDDEVILSNTFRAVVGALYLSTGNESAYIFTRDFVCTMLNQKDVNEIWEIERPIEYLQHMCRDSKLPEPEPRLIGEAGKETLLAVFQVGIYLDRKMLASGFGETVDIAIEVAARHGIARLLGTDNLKPFDWKISTKDCFAAVKSKRTKRILDNN